MSSERELISLYARAVSETVSEHFREARAHEDDGAPEELKDVILITL